MNRKAPAGAYHPSEAANSSPALVALEESANKPSKDVEVFEGTAFVPSAITVPVYQTRRAWTGVDVYLDPANAGLGGAGDVLSIGVYANVNGSRVLVATGRTRERGTAAPLLRMCSARIPIAATFEVVFGCSVIPVSLVNPCRILVVASNDLTSDPDSPDGIISIDSSGVYLSGVVPALTIATDPVLPYELVGVNALAVVANRTVHVVTGVSSIVAATLLGNRPAFFFGIPNIGDTVFGGDRQIFQDLKRRLRSTNGAFTICASTTPQTTTLAAIGDVMLNGWVR